MAEAAVNPVAHGEHYTSFEFGDLVIVSLRDGYIDMPSSRLRNDSGEPLDPLPDAVSLVGGNLRLSVNAYLVIDGARSLLVDAGASNSWHPTMGSLLDGLREAGIDRETITDVAITHTHADHVNGLIALDGSDAFPRLERIFVGAGDVATFTGSLARFRDRIVALDDQRAVTNTSWHCPSPGTPPDTPCTTSPVAAGSGLGSAFAGHLLVWGDTVHVPSLQFTQPQVTWEFDGDQPKARAARELLLDRLTGPGYFVAGAHLDSPGIGYVTRSGEGYDLHYVT
jgi:glyoxylase-like metal-dependent hydrolase (beta-lactamase superfamily II)